MYGLLIAVTSDSAALGATILNRLAITVVELALFGIGVIAWRLSKPRRDVAQPDATVTSATPSLATTTPRGVGIAPTTSCASSSRSRCSSG